MGIERISEFWPSWKPLELLGKGGNGEVYKCIHEEMGVKTYSAIKVISISARQMNTFTFDSGSIRSFCRNLIDDCVNEINVMLSLKSCTNIVAIEDFKVVEIVKDEEWEIFIRMEMLTCLTDYLRDRVLTQAEVVKLGVDLCTALELCHGKNIMHRDIKPANIFINELGDFKLGDFGIARTLEMATAGFSQKGTVTYVAPEVMYSNDYTKAVDIYSLGLVLYQLANNNRLPFLPAQGDYTHTMQNDAIKNRLKGDTFPPACNADEALNSIFRIACEFEPKNRFQSARQMKDSMNKLRSSDESEAESVRDDNVINKKKNINIAFNEEKTEKVIRPYENLQNSVKSKSTVIVISVIAVFCVIVTVISVILFVLSHNDTDVYVDDISEAYDSDDSEYVHQHDDSSLFDYPYLVSYETPDDAGVVVRSESTYSSEKVAVLAEGTPVRIISGFAPGMEYIQIAFEFEETEKNGWVLGKYVIDENDIPYDGQYNRIVSFEQEKTNIYVSNITESGIGEFVGTPSVDEMLKFAMNHSILNYNPAVSGIENGTYNLNGKFYEVRIDADYVDRLSARFFGMDVNAASLNRNDISEGCLYGFSTEVSSQGVAFVKGVYSDSVGDKYKICFTVYLSGDSDESGYYSYTPAQAEFVNTFEHFYDGYVVLQKYSLSGEDAYKIIEFKKTTL